MEEPRPRPRRPRRRRPRILCRRQRPALLCPLSGATQDAERLRLRRPAAAHAGNPEKSPRRARTLSTALQIHPRRRIPRHQRQPVFVAEIARPNPEKYLLYWRRRPVELFVARTRGRRPPQRKRVV